MILRPGVSSRRNGLRFMLRANGLLLLVPPVLQKNREEEKVIKKLPACIACEALRAGPQVIHNES